MLGIPDDFILTMEDVDAKVAEEIRNEGGVVA